MAEEGSSNSKKRGEADGTAWLFHPHEPAAKRRAIPAVKIELTTDGEGAIASKQPESVAARAAANLSAADLAAGDLAVAVQYQALLYNEVQAPAPALVMMAVEEDWRPDERAPRASNGGFPAAGAPGVYAPRAPELAHYFVRVPDIADALECAPELACAPGMSERARAPVLALVRAPVREKKEKNTFTCKFCDKTKEGPGYVACRGCRARFCSQHCKNAYHIYALCEESKAFDREGNLLRSVIEYAHKWAKQIEEKPDKKFFLSPAPNLTKVKVVQKYVSGLPSGEDKHKFHLILVTKHAEKALKITKDLQKGILRKMQNRDDKTKEEKRRKANANAKTLAEGDSEMEADLSEDGSGRYLDGSECGSSDDSIADHRSSGSEFATTDDDEGPGDERGEEVIMERRQLKTREWLVVSHTNDKRAQTRSNIINKDKLGFLGLHVKFALADFKADFTRGVTGVELTGFVIETAVKDEEVMGLVAKFDGCLVDVTVDMFNSVATIHPDHDLDRLVCSKCKTDDDEEKLIMCDGCPEACHTYCLDQPLSEVPAGDWYCFDCQNPKNTKGVEKWDHFLQQFVALWRDMGGQCCTHIHKQEKSGVQRLFILFETTNGKFVANSECYTISGETWVESGSDDAASDGAPDGAADGAAEGAADGAAEGAAEGADKSESAYSSDSGDEDGSDYSSGSENDDVEKNDEGEQKPVIRGIHTRFADSDDEAGAPTEESNEVYVLSDSDDDAAAAAKLKQERLRKRNRRDLKDSPTFSNAIRQDGPQDNFCMYCNEYKKVASTCFTCGIFCLDCWHNHNVQYLGQPGHYAIFLN